MSVDRFVTPGRDVRPGAITAVVCLALAAVVSAMASLNVALPDIARSTHASQTTLEWVIDAYSLVFAALLLAGGAIGDRYGRRRALLVGLVVFGIGSALAMTATTAHELIALRALLGLGAALVMPATLSTITGTFPAAQRTRAVSVWAAIAGGSAVLGLLTSGALLEVWSWPSIFGLNVVLASIAVIGTLLVVPESADPDAPPLDVGGAVLAVLGLVALVFSIIEAPDRGWLSAPTVVGVAVGLVVLGGFLRWELRTAYPLLDPRTFLRPRLAAGSLSILVQFFGFYGFVFVTLQYLQIVRGDSPMLAAVSLLPVAATMMPTARTTPLLVRRFGSRWVCVSGLVLIATGLVVLSRLDATSPYWLIVTGLLPLGAGMGAAMTPATTGITEALPASQQGVGSALNDLSRELGGALGIAVIGSISTAGYRSHLHLTGVTAPVADRARESLAVATRLGRGPALQAHSAFVAGMHGALLCAAAAVLLAATVVMSLLSRSRPSAGADASESIKAPATLSHDRQRMVRS